MKTDIAIVGAGILGLANAYTYASRGHRVRVYERSPKSMGASIRNFGMVWPIGQPAGDLARLAYRSRDLWIEVMEAARLPYTPEGSLHLCHHEDEEAVAREFADREPERAQWISAPRAIEKSLAVKPQGLRGALFSRHEVIVDPRRTIATLPSFLTEKFGVEFHFNTAVRDLSKIEADYKIVCAGDDFQTLYPELWTSLGITRCKLQMMRTAPQPAGWNLGPALAAGLTLRHYQSFRGCSSLAAVIERFRSTMPDYERYGIHVMVSQTSHGELTIGDSHEYSLAVDIFDKPEIDELILRYLDTFAVFPHRDIVQRWNGVYAKHPDMTYFTTEPEPGVRVLTTTGGAGMTLSFGLAEHLYAD